MLSAGWATVNITPPLGVALAGYYVSEGRTEGAGDVYDELHAKALVLEIDRGPVALVTSDLIGMPDSFCAEALDAVSNRAEIPRASIILSASHNHSGPVIDTMPEGHALFAGEFDAEYRMVLIRKLASAVQMARNRASPVRFGVARNFCDINVNRRERDADGRFKPLPFLGRDYEAPIDRAVTVLGFEKPTGERAVLVNYACHAVVLGPNSEISADYPGAMQRFVEQALGSEATVLFTNGAEGDSNPIIHPGSRDDVDLLGQRLGAEVLKAVDNLELRDVRVLRMSRARVSLPRRRRPSLEQEAADLDRLAEENLKLREGQTSGLIQGEMDHSVIMLRHLRRRKYRQTIDAEISALRIADTVLATIPGELFNELGREVAAAAPSGVTIVLVGLANGHIGYLPTAEAYEEGGFEVEATALAPGAGETLRDHLVALVREVSVP